MVIYASPNNPGAEKVAEMLKKRQPGLLTTRLPPDLGKKEEDKTIFSGVFETIANSLESATGIDVDGDGDVGMAAEEAARARQLLEAGDSEVTYRGEGAIRADSLEGYEVPTIMLLYLNGEAPPCSPHSTPSPPPSTPSTATSTPDTFLTLPCPLSDPAAPRCAAETYLGEAGAKLGKELLAAKKAGFPIIMLHENDPAKHGCEFGVFFDGRTPPELLKEGIYTALALALYPGDFQATSFALAALVLGASESGAWTRLKARFMDTGKRKWILSHHKKGDVAPKDAIAPKDTAGTSDAAPPSQTTAAEPTTVGLSTTPSVATTAPSTGDEAPAARRRASDWLARHAQDRDTPLSASDEDLLAHRAVLLEAEVHWKSESTFYKPTKAQLLGEPGRAAADAEAGAPPWSILMVHGKAVHYEEVTAVKMDEKNLEFVVEHTRKRSSRSERLRRQHLRMRTRAEFDLWREALRPTMVSTSDAPALTAIGGRITQHSQTPTPTTRGGAGRCLEGQRTSTSATLQPILDHDCGAEPSESARVRRAQSANATEALEAEEHRESTSEGRSGASRV